ncbi:Guanine nucleotide-binding protein-like 3 [Mortierella sp. GBA30]|nr:Guanine nucleotide-binding protein-like 3 [Mortierella sp. GBA30]
MRAAEAKQRQKEARENAMNKNRKIISSSSTLSIQDMARQAVDRGLEYDATAVEQKADDGVRDVVDSAAVGGKDNSRKAYYREFRKVLENADVILEVLDARDPLGCRTKQIERLIMDAGTDKRIILVLNKIDLAPRENVESWLKYLRHEYPTIAFKASTQSQRTNLGQSNIGTDQATDDMLTSSECLGADQLVKLLKNYCRNANIKTAITVGVIGYPNVGKSSVINSLKRSKVCGVGSTPGFTKVAQEINLDKNIKLLDCPGIVFSKGDNGETPAELLLRNCVKVELLEDPISPVELIVGRCQKEQLMEMYGVPLFEDVNDFLVHLARIRGKLKRGGIPDIFSAARSILNDWNSGKIPFYTIPPVTQHTPTAAASMVEGWSKEFDIDTQEDVQVLASMRSTIDMKHAMAMTAQELVEGEVDMMDGDDMDDDYGDDDTYGDDMAMDEDMGMDGGDQEAPEVGRASKPIINFKPKGKKIEPKVKPQMAFTPEEAELNPRLNQDRKKWLKQQQKKARKAAAAVEAGEDLDMMDDDDGVMMGQDHFGQGSRFDFGQFGGGFGGGDERFDASRFKGTTLILPSVSIGNVPQLTTDLLLSTLKLDRVGCMEDENVIAVVGPIDGPHDTSSSTTPIAVGVASERAAAAGGLSLAVEVFQSKDGKWTLIQQRSPTVPHRSHVYAENLVQFIRDSEFDQVVLLASADGARKIDSQLRSSTPIRYISSPNLPESLITTLQGLGLNQLERVPTTEDERKEAMIRRQEHIVTQDHHRHHYSGSSTTTSATTGAASLTDQVQGIKLDEEQEQQQAVLEKVPRIPNGGIARRLHSLCQEQGIAILTVVLFAMEGDNAPDAVFLANVVNAILKVHIPTPQQIAEGDENWKFPKSWDSLYGNTHHQDMYQ